MLKLVFLSAVVGALVYCCATYVFAVESRLRLQTLPLDADAAVWAESTRVTLVYEPSWPVPILTMGWHRGGRAFLSHWQYIVETRTVETTLGDLEHSVSNRRLDWSVPDRLAGFGRYRLRWLVVGAADSEPNFDAEVEPSEVASHTLIGRPMATPPFLVRIVDGDLCFREAPDADKYCIDTQGGAHVNPLFTRAHQETFDALHRRLIDGDGRSILDAVRDHPFALWPGLTPVSATSFTTPDARGRAVRLEAASPTEPRHGLEFHGTDDGVWQIVRTIVLPGGGEEVHVYGFANDALVFSATPVVWSALYAVAGCEGPNTYRPPAERVAALQADIAFLRGVPTQ